MNAYHFFQESLNQYPANACLIIDKKEYTYRQVAAWIFKISNILQNYPAQTNIGIYATRSLTAYTGLLSCLSQGKTYVVLNKKLPKERNKTIMELANINVLIADENSMGQIVELAPQLSKNQVIIFPEIEKEQIPEVLINQCTVFCKEDLVKKYEITQDVHEDTNAYILFTSGSTGTPKGVCISHKNLNFYINHVAEMVNCTSTDHFSQSSELTFDASVHEMFLCWSFGGALYVVPENSLMAPAKFIKENKLSVWFSPPSVPFFMKKFRMLKDNAFPTLKYTFFGGESLTMDIVNAWKKSAHNSTIINFYGPTECTVAVSFYFLPEDEEKILKQQQNVSIGKIMEALDYCLVNEDMEITTETGELCISGDSTSKGYLHDQVKTDESFIKITHDDRIWYTTGDIVKETEDGSLYYLNRKDFQVKIRGNRVELEEINQTIKEITQASFVLSIPHPIVNGIATSIYSFIDQDITHQKSEIFDYIKSKLPEYMLPKDIIYLEEIPLNIRGKIDRTKLITLIKKS